MGERADHGVDEIERAKLDRRQIDRDRHPVRPRRGFGAGSPEHPFADRNDQARRFGDRNEVARRDHAPGGMTPAQKRLETADAIAGNVDERLIMELELPGGQGVLEIGFHRAPLLGFPIHVLLEEAMPAPALGFGLIERHVGVLEQIVRRLAVVGKQGDAHARADRDFQAVDDCRSAKAARSVRTTTSPTCEGEATSIEDDGEFVAAEPRRQIAVASASRNRCATIRSKRSPVGWPKVSLTSLNRSRSRQQTASPSFLRRRRSIAAAS